MYLIQHTDINPRKLFPSIPSKWYRYDQPFHFPILCKKTARTSSILVCLQGCESTLLKDDEDDFILDNNSAGFILSLAAFATGVL